MRARSPLLLVRVAVRPFESLGAFAAPRSGAALEALERLERVIAAKAERLGAALHAAAGPGGVDREGSRRRLALLRVRRAVHQGRPPGRDLAALEGCAADLLAGLGEFDALIARRAALESRFRAVHAREVERAARAIARAVGEPVVAEGLRLAGRSLYEHAASLKDTPPGSWGHRQRHTALKVLAYLVRFATKTSPNGLFCATSVGGWTAGRSRVSGAARIARTEYLLSVAEARKVAACLAVDPALAGAILPRPNPTLAEEDGAWSFWRPASPRSENDDEVQCRVPFHPLARAFLEEAQRGLRRRELVEAVAARPGAPADRAALEGFLDRLEDAGLLLAEVGIPYSERRPLRWLAGAARRAGAGPAWLPEIEAIEREVDRLGRRPWRSRLEAMDGITRRLAALPRQRPVESDELVRVDAASALDVRLRRSVLREIEEFLPWYARLYAALYPGSAFLEPYASRFLAHHPPDTDVVLSAVYGRFESRAPGRPEGFPEPAGAVQGGPRAAFARVREVLARRALEARAAGLDEVSLDDLDWDRVLGTLPVPRWSCGVLFQLESPGRRRAAAGGGRIVLNGLLPGAGLALARLASLHARGGPVERGPVALELAARHRALERPGAVLAEISFMHEGRTANAGLRPPLLRHEIVLPGDEPSPGAVALELSDLVVRYDSTRARFVLRSRLHGFEVRPVITSGISPEGFVSFLLAVGREDLQPLGYFPGFDLPGVVHAPRFTRGRVVLFRRRWSFEPDARPRWGESRPLSPERFEAASRWRHRWGLPRMVFVHTARDPKPFAVDLESPWAVEHLARACEVAADAPAVVTEMLPAPESLWHAGRRARHALEFLVHLEGGAGRGRAPARAARAGRTPRSRS